MKITTLVDNYVASGKMGAEHGLSLYIEINENPVLNQEKLNILFDTGQSDLFYHNAKHLGIDLSQTDLLIISHGHYDHTGGLAKFLEINDKATVYIRKEAFWHKMHNGKYIGIPNKEKLLQKDNPAKNRFILTKSIFTPISPLLSIISTPNKSLTSANNFSIKHDGKTEPAEDLFCDEQYLAFQIDGKTSLVTGCSHKGIIDIISDTQHITGNKVIEVIGGLHTSKHSAKEIRELSQKMASTHVKYIHTGHCTGIEQYAMLKESLKDRISYNYTGKSFHTKLMLN